MKLFKETEKNRRSAHSATISRTSLPNYSETSPPKCCVLQQKEVLNYPGTSKGSDIRDRNEIAIVWNFKYFHQSQRRP